MSKGTESPTGPAAGKKIHELVEGLGDWRAAAPPEVRRLIHEAMPNVVETWKWMGSRGFEKNGILVVCNAHKQKVKVTFPHGAQLPDPEQVFNNGLGGKAWRAIDLREGDALDAAAFQALVKAAAAYNAGQTSGGWSHSQGADRQKEVGSARREHEKGKRAEDDDLPSAKRSLRPGAPG